jgi:hypothetical protein
LKILHINHQGSPLLFQPTNQLHNPP